MKSSTLTALVVVGVVALFLLSGDLPMWKQANNAQAYLPLLADAERRYHIPTDLLARMAYQESRFRDDIADGSTISPAGAVGLMQMMPQFFPGPLTNPSFAVETAAQYLVQLYRQFGSWQLAAAAYNWGPGNVQKYLAGTAHMPQETSNYVAQVFSDVRITA